MSYLIVILAVVAILVTAFVIHFILQRSANARGDRWEKTAEDRRIALEHSVENEAILQKNVGELLRESADLKTSMKSTEAKLASAKASIDDLVRILSEHPGALPAALHGVLERLRAQVPGAAPPAPAGDPGGGEGGPVHGSNDLEDPRRIEVDVLQGQDG